MNWILDDKHGKIKQSNKVNTSGQKANKILATIIQITRINIQI